MQLSSNIFRGYDIRGLVDKELTPEAYYLLGKGYATFLNRRRIHSCTVGRDCRLTSEEYANAFIKGLNESGVKTINLGLSMSQIVYFSSYVFLTKGSAMITASHNPKEFNGLKLGVGYSDTMVSDEIKELKDIIDREEFITNTQAVNRDFDLFPKYQEELLKLFTLNKKWKIVVDACNTGSGIFYPAILEKAGCEVIKQNCDIDGNFPLGAPDPTESDVLDRLAKRVVAERADLGFAYDTDGDRMAVVDGQGQVLWMDVIVALFAKDVLDYLPKAPIVFNNLCSKVVSETIQNSGGIPVMWKTGHSFIKAKVKESRSPFGGELSGHIFFMDNFFGHDDGAYASLRLLSYLERQNQTLNEVVSLLPQYQSSPEIKLGLADEIKFQLVGTSIKNDLLKAIPDAELNTIDGIRLDTNNSMVVVRASQNGPYITIKFESKTKEEYKQLKGILSEILHRYPEIDWTSGVNTHGLA